MYIKAVKKQSLCSLKKQKEYTTPDNTYYLEAFLIL